MFVNKYARRTGTAVGAIAAAATAQVCDRARHIQSQQSESRVCWAGVYRQTDSGHTHTREQPLILIKHHDKTHGNSESGAVVRRAALVHVRRKHRSVPGELPLHTLLSFRLWRQGVKVAKDACQFGRP